MRPRLELNWAILGFLLSFLFFSMVAGQKEGESPRIGKSIIVPVSESKSCHVHHWIIGLVFVFLILTSWPEATPTPTSHRRWRTSSSFSLLLGLALGGFIHGFTYKDWHCIIIEREQYLSPSTPAFF